MHYVYILKRKFDPHNSDMDSMTKDFAKQRYNTPYACNVI